MISINIHEARTRLSELLRKVEQKHETIVICRNGIPIAELCAWKKSQNPLQQNPKLKKVIFHEDPTSPLGENDWPIASAKDI